MVVVALKISITTVVLFSKVKLSISSGERIPYSINHTGIADYPYAEE